MRKKRDLCQESSSIAHEAHEDEQVTTAAMSTSPVRKIGTFGVEQASQIYSAVWIICTISNGGRIMSFIRYNYLARVQKLVGEQTFEKVM